MCSTSCAAEFDVFLLLPEAEESAWKELYCSASRSSPQGTQRGLGGEQDNKITDLWQLYQRDVKSHVQECKSQPFVFSFYNLLFA